MPPATRLRARGSGSCRRPPARAPAAAQPAAGRTAAWRGWSGPGLQQQRAHSPQQTVSVHVLSPFTQTPLRLPSRHDCVECVCAGTIIGSTAVGWPGPRPPAGPPAARPAARTRPRLATGPAPSGRRGRSRTRACGSGRARPRSMWRLGEVRPWLSRGWRRPSATTCEPLPGPFTVCCLRLRCHIQKMSNNKQTHVCGCHCCADEPRREAS